MDEYNRQSRSNPGKGVMFGVLFLAIFSALFGVFRIRQNLYASKNVSLAQNPPTNSASQGTFSSDVRDALALQEKDTDGDGLNDFDELNRYKTSPYLQDSDSDGFADNIEVASGNDPNCPKGKECGEATIAPTAATPSLENATRAPSPSTTNTVTIPPFTPENARAILRKSGIREEQIQLFDDAALREIYDETVRKLQPEGSARATPSEGAASAVQLRALLKSQGVADALLNSVDDATLLQIFTNTVGKGQ